MIRCLSVLAAALSLTLAIAAPGSAAPSAVTGTLDCSVTGVMRFYRPFLPTELAEPNTRPLGTKIVSETSTCDDSGVVGVDGHIGIKALTVQGKLAAETSCLDFLGNVSFPAKVKRRWLGAKNLGASKATVASVTGDGTQGFVLTTNPITKGPFTGSTVTMRFPLGGNYADQCSTGQYRYIAFGFTSDFGGGWTLSIP